MKIIIIEDDPLFGRKFQYEIESTRVHDVHVFQTAERAIGQLSTIKPDIVFVDHFLDGINGTDVISIINEKLPTCKIVSVSSQPDIKIFEKAMRDGACKYIIKDENFAENLAKFFRDLNNDEKVASTLEKLSNFFTKSKKRTKPLVFLVDDDEVFNFVVQFKIEPLKDCQLETFVEGKTVINNAERKPDLLILDYNLKKTTGAVVIEAFKEISPSTKIIMVSSQSDLSTAVKLIDKGVFGYVRKGEDLVENLTNEVVKALAEWELIA